MKLPNVAGEPLPVILYTINNRIRFLRELPLPGINGRDHGGFDELRHALIGTEEAQGQRQLPRICRDDRGTGERGATSAAGSIAIRVTFMGCRIEEQIMPLGCRWRSPIRHMHAIHHKSSRYRLQDCVINQKDIDCICNSCHDAATLEYLNTL